MVKVYFVIWKVEVYTKTGYVTAGNLAAFF